MDNVETFDMRKIGMKKLLGNLGHICAMFLWGFKWGQNV